jgi:hypothetical protein
MTPHESRVLKGRLDDAAGCAGSQGPLTAVTVEYKIGEAPTAMVKVWGYD